MTITLSNVQFNTSNVTGSYQFAYNSNGYYLKIVTNTGNSFTSQVITNSVGGSGSFSIAANNAISLVGIIYDSVSGQQLETSTSGTVLQLAGQSNSEIFDLTAYAGQSKIGILMSNGTYYGLPLASMTVRLAKRGSPSNMMRCIVRKLSDDSAVATSWSINASTLPALSSPANITFQFNGEILPQEPVRMMIEYVAANSTDIVAVFGSGSSPVSGITPIQYTAGSYSTTALISGSIAFNTSTTVPAPVVTAPNAPTLTVTSQSDLVKILAWNIPTGATSLALERQINNGGFSPLFTFQSTDTSQLTVQLGSGNTYDYRMKAINSAGSSNYSNVITINTQTTTTPPAPTAPAAPVIALQANSATNFNVTWQAVSGATGYNVEEKYQNGNYVSLGDQTGTGLNINLNQGDGTYSIRARSRNSTGYSDYSNVLTATVNTIPVPPSTPNFEYKIFSNGTDYILRTVTDYGSYTGFQFPARAFAQQTLQQSLPNIPATLTANYIVKTATATNDSVVAQALAAQYGTPNIPPPNTTPATAGKLWGIVAFSSALAFLLPTGKKHKYSKRTLKRHA